MKQVSILFLFLALSCVLFAQTELRRPPNPTLLDQPNYLAETQTQIANRLKWFDDAKYGMFIHFGLYSQLGGEWEGKMYKE
jgi:hypothetical protein